ncbi:atrial natriuretic peptide receptor 3-like [Argonauta hians]
MRPRRYLHEIVATILLILFWGDLHQLIRQINGEQILKQGKKFVKIGLILPLNNSYPWSLQRIIPAIEYAVDTIHNDSHLLPNYTLEINVNDSMCSDIIAPLSAFDMYARSRANVFIGPCCEYAVAPIARFSPVWGIPVISAGALIDALKNKMEYKLLTRIQGTYEKYGQFFFTLTRYFNWTNIGIIYNDYIGSTDQGKSTCYFQTEPIWRMWTTFYATDIWHVVIDERRATINIDKILLETSKNTRVICSVLLSKHTCRIYILEKECK